MIELSQRFTPVRPSVYGRMLLASAEAELVIAKGGSTLVVVNNAMMPNLGRKHDNEIQMHDE